MLAELELIYRADLSKFSLDFFRLPSRRARNHSDEGRELLLIRGSIISATLGSGFSAVSRAEPILIPSPFPFSLFPFLT